MSRPLTFQQLQAFRAVVISGTTVAAAEMLHTTQPTISRLIGQAQQASGLKLFVNDRGRLQLTREGRHLFEVVQLNFQGLGRIEQVVAALRESGAGVLRIACTPSLGQSVLPLALEAFVKDYPQVHLNVQTLGSLQIEEGLRQGIYDIAITQREFSGAEFVMQAIHHTGAVCVAALNHRFTQMREVKITDLKGEVLISLPEEDAIEQELNRLFLEKKMLSPKAIETIYSATICNFVARGLGVGVINPYMASVFKDRLCIRKFTPRIPVTTYVAYARYSPGSELAKHFFDALIGVFAIQVGE
jgi:DNA-binding transcriptional LysR family regulator